MATGGYEPIPVFGPDEPGVDNNGFDDRDTTRPFLPNVASMPQRTIKMNNPQERGSKNPETSFYVGEGNLTKQLKLKTAHENIKYFFPYYKGNLD